ncbi:outer membrane putative beta-barrel porin/alpha-amylase [Luteibacter rhizovicinus]|uniref:Outer membrane putative beta-barrel porin/alpha-amylase n=1 Tax=Luteibacter rhizovicinus TaxID=242606 RepID=A0A4R3YQS8_9GAMM|nr:transporter [Luteibacter rhizovicinus]TCV93303.1 outer membrane putative beta-barrel porin/alpha-amylase [Luteibacter rhizovicinus]
MYPKKYLPALLLIALPMSATAEHSLDGVNFTGPLITPNPNALPVGVFNVEPYLIHTKTTGLYDSHGDRHRTDSSTRQWQVALPISYGVSERLTAQVTLNAVHAYTEGRHSSGTRMGDTSLRFSYLLQAPNADGTRPAFAVAVAHRFPTGDYHRLDTNPLNGTGSGAQRSTLSFLGQQVVWMPNGRPLRWRANVSWSPVPPKVDVNGTSVYGTETDFRGTARPGHSLSASAAVEYSVDSRWVLVMEAAWSHAGVTSVTGRRMPGLAAESFHSPTQSDWSLAPAVEYHISPTIGIIAGVQFNIAGRNTASYVSPQAAVNMVF